MVLSVTETMLRVPCTCSFFYTQVLVECIGVKDMLSLVLVYGCVTIFPLHALCCPLEDVFAALTPRHALFLCALEL